MFVCYIAFHLIWSPYVGKILSDKKIIIPSGNYIPGNSWALSGDNARDTLKKNNQPMSQTGWREVSKQLILAHYIFHTILYVTRITLPHSCRSDIMTHNTLGLVSCRACPQLRSVVPIRVQLWGGIIPNFYRFFEILKFWGIYSDFADFSSFKNFENLGLYSGFNENLLEKLETRTGKHKIN